MDSKDKRQPKIDAQGFPIGGSLSGNVTEEPSMLRRWSEDIPQFTKVADASKKNKNK